MTFEKHVAAMLLFTRHFALRVRKILPTAEIAYVHGGVERPFVEPEGYDALERDFLEVGRRHGPEACYCKLRIGEYRLNLEFKSDGVISVYRHRPGLRATPDFLLDAPSAAFVASTFDEFIGQYRAGHYRPRGQNGALGQAGFLEFGPIAPG